MAERWTYRRLWATFVSFMALLTFCLAVLLHEILWQPVWLLRKCLYGAWYLVEWSEGLIHSACRWWANTEKQLAEIEREEHE